MSFEDGACSWWLLQGHEGYEGCQRHAKEDTGTRGPVSSARAVGAWRNIDGGGRAKHAHGLNLKIGVVVVAWRADHEVVVAYARACLGEYLRITGYVSCNNQTVSLESLDVGLGVATHQSLGVLREQKPAEGERVSHGTISCLAKEKEPTATTHLHTT